MGVVRELIARFDVSANPQPIHDANRALDQGHEKSELLKESLGKLAAAFGAFELAHKAIEFVREFTAEARNLTVLANRIGVTTQQVQALGEYARASGLGVDEMSAAMGVLAGKLGDPHGREELQRLGISTHTATGQIRSTYEVLGLVADRAHAMGDRARQTALAMATLGRGGRALVGQLAEGGEAIRRSEEELQELGGGFSDASIAAGVEFDAAMNKVKVVLDSLRSQIYLAIAPALMRFATALRGVGQFLARSSLAASAAVVALVGVAAAFLAVGRAALTMAYANPEILAMAAAIAAVVLIYDDLSTMFEGGQSLIGEGIDKIFGKGASREVIQWLSEEWTDIVYLLGEANRLANSFFGMDDTHAPQHYTQEGTHYAESDATRAMFGQDGHDTTGSGDLRYETPAQTASRQALAARPHEEAPPKTLDHIRRSRAEQRTKREAIHALDHPSPHRVPVPNARVARHEELARMMDHPAPTTNVQIPVVVNVTQTNATPPQIERAVRHGVTTAHDRLAQALDAAGVQRVDTGTPGTSGGGLF